MSQEEILSDFPDMGGEDIKACLAFAAYRERKLFTAPLHLEIEICPKIHPFVKRAVRCLRFLRKNL